MEEKVEIGYMKILIITNSSGGLYLFRRELISRLIEDRNDVVVLAPLKEHSKELLDLGVSLTDVPIDRRGNNIIKDIGLFRKYSSKIKDARPDLIITYTIKANIYGGIASQMAKIPYAVNITGLGTAFEKTIIKVLVVNLYKFALKKAKVVFFENKDNRDRMVSYGCCNKEKTVILQGAGVNTDRFQYQEYPNNEVFRFLFVGRIMKEKGVGELFESMIRLNNSGRKCVLDVVGSYEEDYEDTIRKYENEGWLMYHGYQSDVIPYIAKCDCSVLPSYHEGMSNTNLECASSGRPIITSNIPGCKEAVLDGISGLTCEIKNTESLYAAMVEMMDKRIDERREMGCQGRKHVERNFNKISVVNETVKSLYN